MAGFWAPAPEPPGPRPMALEERRGGAAPSARRRLEGLRDGRWPRARDARGEHDGRRRGVPRDRRDERLGQVDDDEHPRLPRPADARHLHPRGRRAIGGLRAGDSRAVVAEPRHPASSSRGSSLLSRARCGAREPSSCRCSTGGVGSREQPAPGARGPRGRRHGRPPRPRADRAVRWPAAARRRRPGARHRTRPCSSPTSRRATSTRARASRSSRCSSA